MPSTLLKQIKNINCVIIQKKKNKCYNETEKRQEEKKN